MLLQHRRDIAGAWRDVGKQADQGVRCLSGRRHATQGTMPNRSGEQSTDARTTRRVMRTHDADVPVHIDCRGS